ncbi:hypothetical protein H0H92_007996 [Tricholoma furcatifolium]|nr:hypothetical protein H0H92_007996 [Tricholoma furcatifolium]
MTCPKPKGTTKQAGHTSSFTGNKLAWLLSCKDLFLEAQEGGRDAAGKFYTKEAKTFFYRFGTELQIHQDGLIEREVDSTMDWTVLGDGDELEEKVKNCKTILGQWFQHTFKTPSKAAASISSSSNQPGSRNKLLNNILGTMQNMIKERPRKWTTLSIYSEKYYKERLKAKFDATWEKVKHNASPTARISMCHAFIREAWKKEPQEFRDKIELEAQEEHNANLKAYRDGELWKPSSAQEYAQVLDDSPQVLIPLADAISQWLGLGVSFMLYGPMSDGNIGVRSAHSTIMEEQTTKIWPEVDQAGFTQAEKSIKSFAAKFFTQKDCDAQRIAAEDEVEELLSMSNEDEPLEGTEHIENVNQAGSNTQSDVPIDPALSAPAEVPQKVAKKARKKVDKKTSDGEQSSVVHDVPTAPQALSQSGEAGPSPKTPLPPQKPLPAPMGVPAALIRATSVPLSQHESTIHVAGATNPPVQSASVPRNQNASATPLLTLQEQNTSRIDPVQPVVRSSLPIASPSSPPLVPPQVVAIVLPIRPPRVSEADLDEIPEENNVIRRGIAYLNSKDWGIMWEDIVRVYFEFERSRGFPVHGLNVAVIMEANSLTSLMKEGYH